MEIAQASRGSGTESESLKIRVTELKLFATSLPNPQHNVGK